MHEFTMILGAHDAIKFESVEGQFNFTVTILSRANINENWQRTGQAAITFEELLDHWGGLRTFLFTAPPVERVDARKALAPFRLPDELLKGKIWRANAPLIFSGLVINRDAFGLSFPELNDTESGEYVTGKWLAAYLGKRIKIIVQVLEPAPGGEEKS